MEIIQYFFPPIPGIYQFCLDNVKAVAEKMGIKYTLIQDRIEVPAEYITANLNQSIRDSTDWIRLKWLTVDPERFWIDADMLIVKPFDFEFKKGKPYIINDMCPAAALYGNSCKEQMDKLFSLERVRNLHRNVEKRLSNDYYMIPNGYILHLHLGCMLGANRLQNQFCKLKKENGELVFETIKGYALPSTTHD